MNYEELSRVDNLSQKIHMFRGVLRNRIKL